ncbi:C_GCAxxG_C_C family protein [Clostridium sp. 'deep sea']|uniref:C-GCAxxG-C-C family protein n=1 Tax=Clostridium sp. 'deep sea' TaxID=2779445 RepID=UPI0018966D0E|nr:C-GCAxxG-C-C family protein [Clostridium sp. 'deep sea']QOR33732.1 C_GCAxxG_C_C family protein [Clostridium sp. 'deep sea']
MDIKDRVKQLYLEEGFNCAEAMWLCLNEQDLSEEELSFGMKLAGVFGAGLGCGSTCGVVGGAVLTLGRWFGRGLGEPRNQDLPKYAKAFCEWFNEKYNSKDCCDLKDSNNHKPICANMLAESAEFVEKLLDEGLEQESCSL